MNGSRAVVDRLRAEFLGMACRRLTAPQVRRLCGLERALCQSALDSLVDARFLRVTRDGQYACVIQAGGSRPSATRAGLDAMLVRAS